MIKKEFPDVPVIAGGTNTKDAARYIRQWNQGDIPLLLCHPASISHGVNLQAGSHIILWYGLTWSLEQYLQLNARLHRHGQKKGVIVHHLIVKGTVDGRVFRALKSKFKTQSELLDYLKGRR
jgi:SNF2 family DNA or RNA helicase